jgi:hypothetical protein
MIEIKDEEIYLIDNIKITTRCGPAEINKKLNWSSENKDLKKYLNKKYGKTSKEIQNIDVVIGIAIFILADQASHYLNGGIIEIHKSSPEREESVDPEHPILI